VSPILIVHIIAGGLGIVSGFVALYTTKGSRWHRRSGLFFVYVMLVMALSGAGIAAVRSGEASVIGGVLAAYLVVTGLTTIRPASASSGRLDFGALIFALGITAASTVLAFDAVGRGGVREGIPAAALFMFAVVGALATIGDVRVIRSGALTGTSRLARHLWRMCFALYIATASFFLGQADEFPPALRIPALLWLPVASVVLTMFYWIWRIRFRRTLRGIVVGARERV
jgi:hypothetical protein